MKFLFFVTIIFLTNLTLNAQLRSDKLAVYVYSCLSSDTLNPTHLFIQYANQLINIRAKKMVVMYDEHNTFQLSFQGNELSFNFVENPDDISGLGAALNINIKNKLKQNIASIEIDAPILPKNNVRAVYTSFLEDETIIFNCTLTHD